jgi:phospholipid/cholesterol/gamma-HCH transport system permease protein
MFFLAGLVEAVGRRVLDLVAFIGSISLLAWQATWRMLTPPYAIRDIIMQIELLGIRSLRIGLLTAAAAGAVLALQFGFGLAKFGAKDYVGPVVAISLLRELAPVLIALIVGGRIGSGMAAELGSMKVGEQIDAIRALGADPIRKLIVPRLAASILVIPLLTVFADVVGVFFAGMLSNSQFDVAPLYFYQSVLDSLDLTDFFSGIAKSLVFGFLVAVIGCYQGFNTQGGTQGVGLSTTGTVELISISVLLSDFFLTKLFMML